MTTASALDTIQTATAPRSLKTPAESTPRVADAISAILADSNRKPQAYLNEVVVPNGGE